MAKMVIPFLHIVLKLFLCEQYIGDIEKGPGDTVMPILNDGVRVENEQQ